MVIGLQTTGQSGDDAVYDPNKNGGGSNMRDVRKELQDLRQGWNSDWNPNTGKNFVLFPMFMFQLANPIVTPLRR